MSAPCPRFGFHLAFTIAPGIPESRRGVLGAAFLAAAAAYGLACEARDEESLQWVVTGDGLQATESDRQQLIGWLARQPEIASHRAGPLTDLTERV
ncbi:MAG TPA: hypothetical protein VG432_16365 [Gemmatimonadaceae bacterium]|nr:hypothetical protein [Gemmatimonadaceae bacterium]